MYHRTRIAQIAVVAGLGLIVAGGAGLTSAAAGSNPSTADTTPTTEAASTDSEAASSVTDDDGEDAVTYTSSVTIAGGGTRPTPAEVLALATVTATDAVDAALATTPGTATRVALHVEDGNVVWEVHVLDQAGATSEIVVDAGNASVLATELDDDTGRGPRGRRDIGEATTEYTSSVTVAGADVVASEAATVSAVDAIAAAVADTPGTAAAAALRSVDGNVVWQVFVVDEAGAGFRVTVDAGNASVLATVAGEDVRRGPGGRGGGRGPGGDHGGRFGDRPGDDESSDGETDAADDTAADATTATTTA